MVTICLLNAEDAMHKSPIYFNLYSVGVRKESDEELEDNTKKAIYKYQFINSDFYETVFSTNFVYAYRIRSMANEHRTNHDIFIFLYDFSISSSSVWLHGVSFLSENVAKLFLFFGEYGIIKGIPSVIVSFLYQREYTIADEEVVANEGICSREIILEYIQMRKRPAS